MQRIRLYLLLAAAVLTLSRCDMSSIPESVSDHSGRHGTVPVTEAMVRLNREMQERMQQQYLWNGGIDPELLTDEAAGEYDSQELFYEMLAEQDRSSTMRTYAKYLQTATAVLKVSGYGAVFCPTYVQGLWCVYVAYVHPDSPLWQQHIRRGDILTKLNDENAVRKFFNGSLNSSLAQQSATFTFRRAAAGDLRTMKVNRGVFTMTPLLHTAVYTGADGAAAGYLVCNQLEDYPDSGEKLAACFAAFREAGVTSVVIDLRYNEGASLRQAALLASWLLPASCTGEVTFIKQQGNGSKTATDTFSDIRIERQAGAPDIRRVAVITSEITAGAAENFIHCLRAYYPDLYVVGHQTAGKTYIKKDFFFPEPDESGSVTPEWVYSPVVAQAADKNGVTIPADGIPASLECEDDLSHNFGVDANLQGEACLEAALQHVMSQEP